MTWKPFKAKTPRICRLCPNEFMPNSPTQLYCKTCVPDCRVLGWVVRFGISKPMYDALVVRQNGGCGICHRPLNELPTNRIVIDHDHKTEQVRGILCMWCNTWMAALDEQGWLELAKQYLNTALLGDM